MHAYMHAIYTFIMYVQVFVSLLRVCINPGVPTYVTPQGHVYTYKCYIIASYITFVGGPICIYALQKPHCSSQTI